jgi:hypothetical protein
MIARSNGRRRDTRRARNVSAMWIDETPGSHVMMVLGVLVTIAHSDLER